MKNMFAPRHLSKRIFHFIAMYFPLQPKGRILSEGCIFQMSKTLLLEMRYFASKCIWTYFHSEYSHNNRSWPIFWFAAMVLLSRLYYHSGLILFETSKIAAGRAEIDTFWDEWRKSKSQEYNAISDQSLEMKESNWLTSFWLASEALLAGSTISSSMGRSSPKRFSPLRVRVLLFSPSKKVLLLRAMEEEEEEEVVGLAVILSLLSSLRLFSLALLGFIPSLSSITEAKFVGASRTRGVVGRDRVRSKASSIESTPESFEPFAVRGFDLGRSDRERCCFWDI